VRKIAAITYIQERKKERKRENKKMKRKIDKG
jgi:hypothetical protein